jgi:hypothetical protein
MPLSLSVKDKLIAFLATAVLLTTVAKADASKFLHSSPGNSHISGIYALYIDKEERNTFNDQIQPLKMKQKRKN